MERWASRPRSLRWEYERWGCHRDPWRGAGQCRTVLLLTTEGGSLSQNTGVLGLIHLLRNGHPRGSFLPLPAISQQSNQLCKASGVRADHGPFLFGKGLFACFL